MTNAAKVTRFQVWSGTLQACESFHIFQFQQSTNGSVALHKGTQWVRGLRGSTEKEVQRHFIGYKTTPHTSKLPIMRQTYAYIIEQCIIKAAPQDEDMSAYLCADGTGGWLPCKNRSVSQADHQSRACSAGARATIHIPGAPASLGLPTSLCIINLNQPLFTWSVTLIKPNTFTERR